MKIFRAQDQNSTKSPEKTTGSKKTPNRHPTPFPQKVRKAVRK
ncbi:unnamed protein product [Moneuplotes crassus]|uniref:Uncharacterized protein n=1 Tax=Euplotes crassus TaxID=5936 RepID=A0AAD2D599_EUPCR|nr:unnamed protein product [Moneuplotes crassus]